jgi:hypothetical protein
MLNLPKNNRHMTSAYSPYFHPKASFTSAYK